jgi:acyl-CoA reductase-like NAD-dependent aldehyde dehydrogenase
MAEVATGAAHDATRAVDVATQAFEEGAWPRLSARERGRVLTKASFLVREQQEPLAELEARNGGKPISAARGEIDIVANVFEYWGGAANKIAGETIPIMPPGLDVTLREPVGVCALITPWNFPAVIASWKIAPRFVRQHRRRQARIADPSRPLRSQRFSRGRASRDLSVLPGPGSTTAAR